ncbi:N-acetylneuraminate synthase [Clostridium fungisolvens]|uniref:N,N'-diacetyllegionaminic acid synthase n=1 Tax=Clostridium fungisolvens TaxID=1604897 RepID=A0A6V8SIP6_9CLOT|nr:N-acetylneuraminate synthase [Clostridium fungisolvens]GFP77104.1 N,N'-diacetyllegionaminic acid synthase [Clostridium fungisolvens]
MITDKVFIIAEAGVNHNGDINLAKQMIDVASTAGVDAIKFQTFKADKLVTRYASKAMYQLESTDTSESQYEMLKKLELDYNMHLELIKYCEERKVKFLSSPFDLESIELLDSLGIDIFKIPSGEIENTPYLKRIARLNKEVILSTGMCNLADIEFALDILKNNGAQKVSVLHCNTEYPTPMEDVNLRAMLTIRDAFKVEVGYSDHTNGLEVPIAAVAMGAKIIEKHFTLDKNMIGPDHKASLDPDELMELVRCIRNIEKALGSGVKRPSKSEDKNKRIARKSIVAKREIKAGELFSENNMSIKRPGSGISPKFWDELINKKSTRDYEKDEMIEI